MRFTRDGTLGNTRSDKSRRILSCILFVCLVGLGALVEAATIPFSVLDGRNEQRERDVWRTAVNETNWWTEHIRQRLIRYGAASRAIEGFVIGEIDDMPPWKGGVEERTRGQTFERFPLVAATMFRHIEEGTIVMLAPGGVVAQTFPKTQSILMHDFLAAGSGLEVAATQLMMHKGGHKVFGPMFQAIPVPNASWQLAVCSAIHNATSIDSISPHTFWGFTVVVKDLVGMLDVEVFTERMKELRMDYLVYITDDANLIHPITTSLPQNSTEEDIQRFSKVCFSRPVLPHIGHWFVCMRSTTMIEKHSTSTVALLIVGCVFISLIAFVCGVMVVLPCLREFDSRMNAPKTVPFVMTIIGPCNAERLFELAPAEVFPVLEKYAKLQKAVVHKNRGYIGLQVHPYTATFITRDVETAIKTCFDLLDGVQSERLDEPLKNWLGAEGALRIASAIHWCADAYIRVETVNGRIRYEGNDVKYCERMWMFVPPNKVTISEHAMDNIRTLGSDVKITQIGSVFVRGVQEKQVLFDVARIIGSTPCTLKEDTTVRRMEKVDNASIELTDHEAVPATDPLSSDILTNKCAAGGSDRHCNPLDMATNSAGRTSYRRTSHERGLCGPHGDPSTASDSREAAERRNPGLVPEVSHVRVDPGSNGAVAKYIQPPDQHVNPLVAPGNRLLSINDDSLCIGTAVGDSGKYSGVVERGGNCQTNNYVKDDSASTNEASKGDFITEALMRPWIPNALNTHFRVLFEQYSVFLDFSYESVRTVIFYFYIAYNQLLKPLAGPERTNLFNRFVIAFGVPPQNILEALAVRCALRHIQHLEGVRTMLWRPEQERLQPFQDGNEEDGK